MLSYKQYKANNLVRLKFYALARKDGLNFCLDENSKLCAGKRAYLMFKKMKNKKCLVKNIH
jgi:hypothetical protein